MNKKPGVIAVDLTPVLPGGENGGAKIFVLELLRQLGVMHPEVRFILLTRKAAHEELASMDSSNISRRMVIEPAVTRALRPRLEKLTRQMLPHLPSRIRQLVMNFGYRLNAMLKRGGSGAWLSNMGVELLFCPFTAPTYFEPGIPTVCTIYDLQYKTYPEFFAAEDVAHRGQTFIDACRRANALAAISDYTRQIAIRHGNLAPDRIQTIHLRMAQRIVSTRGERTDLLVRLGVGAGRYLIYPANFWKHKNHEMLLTAFGMACKLGLAADMKLVCTGAPGERQRYLIQAAAAMGLAQRMVFPGFLPNDELAALLGNARAMVFPSLYEGFGLPIIEAMAAGIPVACSNLTSLPEVAADAAVLFDPRMPTHIAQAIITLDKEEDVRNHLIATGYERAQAFADSERMAHEYWHLFLYAVNRGPQTDLVSGVYADGWCSQRVSLQLVPTDTVRTLELEFTLPAFLPAPAVQVTVLLTRKAAPQVFELKRGRVEKISLLVAANAHALQLQIAPGFIPKLEGISEDTRRLTVQLQQCILLTGNGAARPLFPDVDNDSHLCTGKS